MTLPEILFTFFVGLLERFAARPQPPHDPWEDDDTRCTACGGDALEVQAPGVYACRACGYEGGSQRSAHEARQQDALAAALPEAQRRARARGLLEEVQRALLSCEGTFERAAESLGLQLGIEEDSNDRAYGLALGELFAALDQVRQATVLDPFVPQPALHRLKDADEADLGTQGRRSTFDLLLSTSDVELLEGSLHDNFSRADARDACAWVVAYRAQLDAYLAA